MESKRNRSKPRQAALEGISKLFHTREYSDLTLLYRGNVYPVHRAVVCSRSPVIKAACDGPFKEGIEAKINIEAPSASPGSIKRMLSYIYTHDYDDKECHQTVSESSSAAPTAQDNFKLASQVHDISQESEDPEKLPEYLPRQTAEEETGDKASVLSSTYYHTESLINNVHVYAMADYYQIPDLKSVAKEKLIEAMQEFSGDHFQEVVTEVYEVTGENDLLREIISSWVACNRHEFLADNQFLDGVSFIGSFMKDLVKNLLACHEGDIVDHNQKAALECKKIIQELDIVKQAERALQLKFDQREEELKDVRREKAGAEYLLERIYSYEGSSCRHCRKDVGLKVEKTLSGHFELRCRDCRTRPFF